ncbi:MAG: InlB B-repeat-containing protein [Slackia sp.]|nr:InlB B-repeat-containing protein [Slackia sp.]
MSPCAVAATAAPPPHFLTLTSDTVKLTGDVTFENVYISSKTLYANGHHLTLGEGFGGGEDGRKRMIVYGGSDGDLAANTHVTVLGGVYKLIAGGNSAGTLTGNTHVEFGGNAHFPNADEGKEEGDFVGTKSANYNLYLDAKGEGRWNGPVLAGMDYEYGILPYGIYGGGTCGNTNGNTSVEMTGGTVYQIFGGGAARRNPSHASNLGELDDLGRVSGNTSVIVSGGQLKSVYGGGYNDIFVFSSYEYDENGVPADARSQRAVVGGDTYVEIGGDAHVAAAEQSEDTSTSGADYPAVYGGSFHSTVNNTQVVIGGKAVVESGELNTYGYGAVYGGGCNDIIRGTSSALLKDEARIGSDQNKAGTSVVSQGKFSALTPMGRTSESRCYFGGAPFDHPSEIQNSQNKQYAATAEVSGGSVDVLMAGVKSRMASKQPMKTCNGNVQLKQSGGAVLSIESGSVYEKNLVIEGNADILVTGGTTEKYILGRYRTSDLGNSEIKGACTLTFSGCGGTDAFRMSPLIWSMDSVHVQDNAHVAVFGDHTLFDSNKKPFTVPLYQVKDLTIDGGSTLAFKQEADITGNLVANGQLNMARVKKSINIGGTEFPIGDPKAVTLTAAGTACGNGMLLPIENPTDPKNGSNYGSYSEPVVDEEYVYAQTVDSDMKLSLAQGADKFFVDRKNSKTANQDVWFINKQVAKDVTVTFDKNGGNTEADPRSITVTSGSTVGTLPTEPTRDGYTFLGWNTRSDGNGEAFDESTPVTSDITVYAQWEKAQEQLWYYELYYQSYAPDGDQTDKNGLSFNWIRQTHGQGGWAYPDDNVSIGSKKFDGKQFPWDAIDGSGKETLGVHYVFDENFGPHRLSATCAEATKDNPLKIYYRATPHTLTYEYEGTIPDGAPQLPAPVNSAYSAPVKITAAPSMEGWEFSGWKVKSPEGVTIAENGTLTMPNNDVVLVGSWTKTAAPIEPTTAAYKVEHYKQQLDGTYQLADTDFPLYGKIGEKVTATPKGYDGYHINAEQSELTGTVFMPYEQDGKPVCLVLKAYYDLDQVTLHYDLNGGTGAEGVDYADKTLPVGTEVTVAKAPTLEGHDFLGWKKEIAEQPAKETGLVQPGDTFKLTADTTLTAQWEEKNPVVPPVDPKPDPNPEPEPGPDPEPEPGPGPKPDPQPEPEPSPEPEPDPQPDPEGNPGNGQQATPSQPDNPGTNSGVNGQPQTNAAIPAMNDFSNIIAATAIGVAAFAAVVCIAAYRKVRKNR